jgi:ADP-dependent NAD(P)H-hydrate dehydratase / NAD(P)H-hydrate epimerase
MIESMVESNAMKQVLSRAEARAFDLSAVAKGVPSLLLMENAGRAATDVIVSRYGVIGHALVVCGVGNNGGDGWSVARGLVVRGWTVAVCEIGATQHRSNDALVQREAFVIFGRMVMMSALADELANASLVVDALFGTGLSRAIAGPEHAAIAAINAAGKPVVALDLPSGIDADTGVELGISIRATDTICFAAIKRGLVANVGLRHAGTVHVVDIGVPMAGNNASAAMFDAAAASEHIKPRVTDVNKVRAGHVLIIGGSPGKGGAGELCALGALRAGAGLVSLASRSEHETLSMPEIMRITAASLRFDKWNAIVIGPGMGIDLDARSLLSHALANFSGPMVLDADALGLLTDADRLTANIVLTPHAGELARMLGVSWQTVEADRFGSVRAASERYGATVVLKGPRTLIASPSHCIVVNSSGSPALAVAGSGDVLAGVIGAMMCELPAPAAAACGVFVHGLAGEVSHDRGLLASEIANAVPHILQRATNAEAQTARRR